jgi:hypothetical protein
MAWWRVGIEMVAVDGVLKLEFDPLVRDWENLPSLSELVFEERRGDLQRCCRIPFKVNALGFG